MKAATVLTFLPGQVTKAVSVSVAGDLRDEPTENFKLVLSSPANATIAVGSETCTINDNDPTPSITVTNATVTEPDTGTVNATFTVRLSAASGQTVSVKYATANGAASPAAAGTDYTGVALTTLTFSPGQTSKTVSVVVRGDLVEDKRDLLLEPERGHERHDRGRAGARHHHQRRLRACDTPTVN